MNGLPPRVVVAGVSSGVGKTTVATGLMAAFARRGVRVSSAKVGPDYIDPGYHTVATGRVARNLDAWMSGPDAIAPLAARAGADTDLLVIEGVMGLFDGAADGEPSSTADVARLLDAPVLLVIDASAMSASVAALVHGFTTYDPSVRIGGIVLNRVGSDNHEQMLRRALAPPDIPIVGALRRDTSLEWRQRHLGLVPVLEQTAEVRRSIEQLGDTIATSCDLDAIARAANAAPRRRVSSLGAPRTVGRARIAMPTGPAFGFVYPDNIEALEAAGAEILPFDPINDSTVPADADGLYIAGGFPEVFVEALAANTALLADIRARVRGGLVTWAECGGLLWLSDALDDHPMAGVLPTRARMTGRLTIGYRTATPTAENPIAAVGDQLRGHEFHYSTTIPAGTGLDMSGRDGTQRSGFACPSLLASYLHLHLGAAPGLAERFVSATLRTRQHR